jgi:hypothetical protein
VSGITIQVSSCLMGQLQQGLEGTGVSALSVQLLTFAEALFGFTTNCLLELSSKFSFEKIGLLIIGELLYRNLFSLIPAGYQTAQFNLYIRISQHQSTDNQDI